MSRIQRIQSIGTGLFMLIAVLIICFMSTNGPELILIILAVSLILQGLRSLVYYFSMSRFMVGGVASLLIGVFFVELGIFSLSLTDDSKVLMLLYLAGWNAISGVRAILRAREERKYKASSWKRNAAYGAVSMLIAISCFILNNRPAELSVLYCVGLGYSGVMKIVDGFRRTEIVYIQ